MLFFNRMTNSWALAAIFLGLFLYGLPSCTTHSQQVESNQDAYLLYYFEGNAGEKAGLYAAYSYNLHDWHLLKQKICAPQLGEFGVFRDPCIIRDKMGEFHMVWTCGSSGFGYAHSADGIDWQGEKFITVSDSTRGFDFANVWAPEFYVEQDTTYIIWSSTLREDYTPPKEAGKWWNSTWNHSLYYTKTVDFKHFSPPASYWNPDFQVIDGSLYKTDSLYYLFFKDERKGHKNLMMAQSENMMGPFTDTLSLAAQYTEGPMYVKTDTALVLYYDYYPGYFGYRYATTKNMKDWNKDFVPLKHGFQDIMRHGTLVKVSGQELVKLRQKIGSPGSGLITNF
ncbi:hypothetical protein PEPS_41020 (plasmid) [Persicobacter psychrovividus]|uniref:Uncharacterized protein n=2 Tax=Persicobacter psychrovividus TaxID=387638 RepID=A0ABM7VLP0_9BACT|nr:hypothetical protein PEPS_41020 [Persicobacter psychrovividus]